MKVLVAVVIGVILGSAGTAVARDSSSSEWIRGGKGFTCYGTGTPTDSVVCETKEKPRYKLTIIPSAVDVTYGVNVILLCGRGKPPRRN